MVARVSPERSGACPGPEELRAFSMGRISPERSEIVAGHLDGCPRCLATLDTLDDDADSLVYLLRCPIPTELIGLEACQPVLSGLDTDELPSAEPETGSYVPRSSAGEEPTGWGDYRVLEKLGQGGMGTVYKAVHTRLGKVVAVKVLPADRVADPRTVTRFHREMEAVGRLEHRHLVRALDAREEAGVHLLVMEYLEGADLARLLHRHGPLPVADACEVVRQAAVGLQYAHERFGLVHRDIKPSNLMLTPDGTVKVLDLGLARLARPREHGPKPVAELTSAEECLGTYDYMAPEQWLEASTADIRADIYSLGCTLYHLLTGRLPYSGPEYDTPGKKILGHASRPLPSLAESRADVPAGLANVVERMTAKEPANRFASPAEVVAALEPFCAGHDLPALLASEFQPRAAVPAQPVPGAASPPSRLARRRRRWIVSGTGVAVALAVLIGSMIGMMLWVAVRFSGRPSSPATPITAGPRLEAPAAQAGVPIYLTVPRIKHFRPLNGAKDKNKLDWLGWIGDPSPEAQQGDYVKTEAEIHQGYLYLLAINPDGTSELLFPENEARPPTLGSHLSYPTAPLEYTTLDDTGLVGIVVLAARKQLPPFAHWRPPVNGQAWKTEELAGPWSFDGQAWAPMMRTRVGKARIGPKSAVKVCQWLQNLPEVLAVRAVVFTVRPKPPKLGGGKP